MRKIFLLLMLMIFLSAGCGGNAEETEKLVIGVDDEYAPMGFRDEHGEIIGFDIDLAAEAVKRLGAKAEFKPIDWTKKEEEITSGNVDMIWNGLNILPEREEYMVFTKPYMDNRQIILVRKNDDWGIHSEYDLKDKKIGTQAGSTAEAYIIGNEALKKSLADCKPYPNLKEAFAYLDGGEIDALVCDEIAGRYEMARHSDKFEAIEVTVGPVTEIGVGFRKDNIKLRDEVQTVFDEMIKDGTARKISEKWFQADLIKSRR